MAFVIFCPHSPTRSLQTSNALINQIWQEFVMIRHLPNPSVTLPGFAPWIDQAKTYYLDAAKSDWRSGGLLYYYSFLNLAKAFLVYKGILTHSSLVSTSLYHGLSSNPQSPARLTDFKFTIHPTAADRMNVFSMLYESVTGKQWPHPTQVTVNLASILGHCSDVSSELEALYGIKHQVFRAQSLIRISGDTVWFEMAVHESNAEQIRSYLTPWIVEEVKLGQLNEMDKMDWLLSCHRPAISFTDHAILRAEKRPFTSADKNSTIQTIMNEAGNRLRDFSLPTVVGESFSPRWLFVCDATIGDQNLRWHPLLSNYLTAFVISTILRYQPQLLDPKTRDYFLAEAWCSQAAVTTLRHFLMLFTAPPLTIEAI